MRQTLPNTDTIDQCSIQLLKSMSNFVSDAIRDTTVKLEWNITIGPSVILAREGLSRFLFGTKVGFELVFSQTQIIDNIHSIFIDQGLFFFILKGSIIFNGPVFNGEVVTRRFGWWGQRVVLWNSQC